MTRAAKRGPNTGPPADEMARLHHAGFSLLPLGGGDDGKKPLVSFKGKPPLPLRSVLGPMHGNGSQCYGIRLHGLAVIDCDEDDPDLVAQLEARFGASPVHVKTPRGRHLYYRAEGRAFPNLKNERLPVDIKRGGNSYVMGPGSVRPDGGTYLPLKGDLAVDHLPLMALSKPATPARSVTDHRSKVAPDLTPSGLIPEGMRNTILMHFAGQMVEYVDGVEELFGKLQAIRGDQFENPETFSDSEVWGIANWRWKIRCANKLYHGRNSEFMIHRAAIDAIRDFPNSSDAIALYVTLVDQHGHTPARRFPLDYAAMFDAGLTDLSRERFRAARRTLEAAGLLEVAQNHSAGRRKRTYRLKKFRANLPANVTILPS